MKNTWIAKDTLIRNGPCPSGHCSRRRDRRLSCVPSKLRGVASVQSPRSRTVGYRRLNRRRGSRHCHEAYFKMRHAPISDAGLWPFVARPAFAEQAAAAQAFFRP